MNLKSLVAAAALVCGAAPALATPQYTGNTFGAPTLNESGYYIWNDEASPSDWHIRWTSNNAPVQGNVSWFGSIIFENSALGSYSEFLFEGSDSSFSGYVPGLGELISWTALTNNTGGVDGLDFSLDSDVELMEFNLGSSLFAGLAEELYDPGVAGVGIYIGDGEAGTNVLVKTDRNGGIVQSFEIHVPEPASLALLGLGLAGLGVARRKQAKA